jgi:hypothetical protein
MKEKEKKIITGNMQHLKNAGHMYQNNIVTMHWGIP